MLIGEILNVLTSFFPAWFSVILIVGLAFYSIFLIFRFVVWIIEIIPGF